MLRDPAPPPPPPAPPPARRVRGQKTAAASAPPPPPPPPDLIRMLSDDEARIRRRAALAIGRVGLAEGVHAARRRAGRSRSRSAADGGVRARSARRRARARSAGRARSADPSPLVQGSAAEALGLIGDAAAADAIGTLVAPGRAVRRARAAAGRRATMCGATRRRRRAASAIYALVRLKAYPQLAAAVLDGGGQPRVRWWPVAFALQRLEDKRALPALLTLAKEPNPYTRAFAVKGLAALKDRVGAAGADAAAVERRAQRADRDRPRARPRSAIRRRPSRCCGSSATRPPIRRSASKRSSAIGSASCSRRSATRCSTCWPIPARRSAPRRCDRWRRSIRENFVDGAVRPRSRSALERPRRARHRARHAAAGERPAAARGDARPTPISA